MPGPAGPFTYGDSKQMRAHRIMEAGIAHWDLQWEHSVDLNDEIPIVEGAAEDEFRGKLHTDPLPDEIARRTAEIRATCDAAEELKRREQPVAPSLVPLTDNNRIPRAHP